MNNYFAHSSDAVARENWHPLAQHLRETADQAAEFLSAVGCAEFGRAAGLLHDLGKYSLEFQRRLSGGPRVDHSSAGADEAIKHYGNVVGKLIAFCVAGHHAGLADGVNGDRNRITALEDRLANRFPSPAPEWKREIQLPKIPSPPIKPRGRDMVSFSFAFLARMVYSALVDADYLDTAAWYAGLRDAKPSTVEPPTLGDLAPRLDAYLADLKEKAEDSDVNELRQKVLLHARSRATEDTGLFTLTVPTGGGKTLTSLAFALDHAKHHGLARVIYVIPYTSIAEQTADVFREALLERKAGSSPFIVEHHSAFDAERSQVTEGEAKLRLATENWDAPIIVTTAVQFFESLFSNRPARCRKLHNIANSVVVLDEVQMLPLKLLRPCVAALDELARNWRTSIVLCTATQPALEVSNGFSGGFENTRELAPEPVQLSRALKRVRIRDRGPVDDLQVAEGMRASHQSLCIVNTRRHARELYAQIRDVDGALHLTTLMCAAHRSEVLERARARLADSLPVRLVSTSLIECGVDVDFPVVWRAAAGLESVVQAAGRCNREGRVETGDVFVFEPRDRDGRRPPPEVQQRAAATRNIMRQHADPLELEAIQAYFKEVYWIKGDELDAEGILAMIRVRRESCDFPFETVAEKFRMIETILTPVIVPYCGADGRNTTVRRLLEALEQEEVVGLGNLARRLQPYVVPVTPNARDRLVASGQARYVREDFFGKQFAVLSAPNLYRFDVGLAFEESTLRDAASVLG